MKGPISTKIVSCVASPLQSNIILEHFNSFWKPYKEELNKIKQENFSKIFCKHLVSITDSESTVRTFWVRYSTSQYRTVNIYCYTCARDFVVSVLNGVQADRKDIFLGLFTKELQKWERLMIIEKRNANINMVNRFLNRDTSWLI